MAIGDLLTLALTTGFAAALMNIAYTEVKEWLGRRRSSTQLARPLALRLAVILEAFADGCATATEISDDDELTQYVPRKMPAVPEMKPFPDDAEGWRYLRPELAALCLALPNQIASSKSLIKVSVDAEELRDRVATLNVVRPALLPGEFYPYERAEEECLRLGLTAWTAAQSLRREYGLPVAIEPPDADIEGYFRSNLESEKELKEAREAARETFLSLFGNQDVTLVSANDVLGDGIGSDVKVITDAAGNPIPVDISTVVALEERLNREAANRRRGPGSFKSDT